MSKCEILDRFGRAGSSINCQNVKYIYYKSELSSLELLVIALFSLLKFRLLKKPPG